MSLFRQTCAEVDKTLADVDALVASAAGTSGVDVEERKAELDRIDVALRAVNETVARFVEKADEGEKDANKRLYGPGMVAKIRGVNAKLTAGVDKLDSVRASITDEWVVFAEEKARVEDERKMAEERERVRKEQIEREEEVKKQQELERLEELAAAKREEEEKARLKQELERRLMLERDAEEKERARKEIEVAQEKEAEMLAQDAARKKVEEEATAKAAQEMELKLKQQSISIIVKSSKGKTLALDAVPQVCTVAGLKEIIANVHAVPAPTQRLIFQGRLLDDSKTIDAYGIKSGTAVHLVENQRAAASAAPTGLAAKPKPIVPPGTLCRLMNGEEEFNRILKNCSETGRLFVVDWFAPWCGPCRAIAPVYERLATRFADVTFVKIDTEASPANAQLASQRGITAYPTFHYYVNGSCVHQFSGANATRIEDSIKQYRAVAISEAGGLSQASGSASSSATPSAREPGSQGPLGARVFAALNNLKNSCPPAEFVVAVRTLLTFVRNVVDHPGQAKYRKVRTANTVFQNRLASKVGGMECMNAFGFEPATEGADAYLILSESAANHPELTTVKAQLERALSSLDGTSMPSGATAIPGAAPRAQPGRTPVVPGGLPGMGGMGSMDPALAQEMMNDPGFARIAQQLAADPAAMASLMQAQQAIANGDYTAMHRLAADPALAQLQNAMASNPSFMGAMMRGMGVGGGAGMGAMPGLGVGRAQGAAPTQAGATNPGVTPAPGATPVAPVPHIPGAPTTAEEEDRLLQEAIRLSMQDASGSGGSGGDQSMSDDAHGDGGANAEN